MKSNETRIWKSIWDTCDVNKEKLVNIGSGVALDADIPESIFNMLM